MTDESGINWSAGPNRTNVVFDSPTSGYKWAMGSNDNPGELSVSFNQGDEGAWTILRVQITDIYGNRVGKDDVGSLGLLLISMSIMVFTQEPRLNLTHLQFTQLVSTKELVDVSSSAQSSYFFS